MVKSVIKVVCICGFVAETGLHLEVNSSGYIHSVARNSALFVSLSYEIVTGLGALLKSVGELFDPFLTFDYDGIANTLFLIHCLEEVLIVWWVVRLALQLTSLILQPSNSGVALAPYEQLPLLLIST